MDRTDLHQTIIGGVNDLLKLSISSILDKKQKDYKVEQINFDVFFSYSFVFIYSLLVQ